MTRQTDTLAISTDRSRRRALDFFELTKPRVVSLVLITTFVGFYLGMSGAPNYLCLLHTLIGTALDVGGALALNQLMGREADAKMNLTQMRPLPEGRVQPGEKLIFGVTI